MKRVGFFKRIGKPTQLGNLPVKTGDVIKADFDFMMEQKEGGWMYIRTNQETPKPLPTQPRPIVAQRPPSVPSFEPTVIKTEPPQQLTEEEVGAIKEVTSLYESIEKERQDEMDKSKPQPQSIEVNIDKLRELKKLTNKDWFAVTKDQSIKLLTDANIDFSHVPKTKWDLVKFIKGIIKDL
jgi:hypothetical protein